jgi:DNA replication protein DnaC
MKNIEKTKSGYTKLFAKELYSKDSISELTEVESSICSSLAEMWAYIYSVVPEEHSHFTIFDFMGYTIDKISKQRKNVMPASVALHAKNEICKYCWGMEWQDIKAKKEKIDHKGIMKFLRGHSKLDRRLKSGNNVAIYGSSSQPIGRTMVASIIMKEAIKLRVTHHTRKHTYDWIDFNTLVYAAKKDSFDLADYRSCDFLVVDNITDSFRTAKQNTFINDMIDPFFNGRFYNKLPTILVFKFNIDNPTVTIEKDFGVGINKIIESNRTYKIPLSGGA